MFNFRVEFYAEFCLYGIDYAAFQTDYFLRVSLACIIYYHKRLLVIDCCAAASASFPSALLDHPGCRNFDSSIRQVIMRNLIVYTMLSLCGCLDPGEMLRTDNLQRLILCTLRPDSSAELISPFYYK